MRIESIFQNLEYLEEVANLTEKEWGHWSSREEYQEKVEKKKRKILAAQGMRDYEKLLLLEGNTLIGFVSLFPHDGEERLDLAPWYATMYIKKEYRGKGYSKLLKDALLKEAKKRGFQKVYLKTTLKNYYEKMGAIYMEQLLTGEKLYYFNLEESRSN